MQQVAAARRGSDKRRAPGARPVSSVYRQGVASKGLCQQQFVANSAQNLGSWLRCPRVRNLIHFSVCLRHTPPTLPPPVSLSLGHGIAAMAINYLILLSRQGKVRLAKWFTTLSPKEKAKIVKDVSQLVLARRTRMCNFLEYKDTKIVYRRYASLFFIVGCASDDNELITLEIIHRYVEQMDKYYGNVCELDIIFSFTKAYYILDELILAGELQESSKKNVLRCIGQQDSLEDMEAQDHINGALKDVGIL
ncbi:clathrin adaptor complex small chain-domain-containing protein [Coniella lustricola]|uniref:AP-1 complex subunit sigma-1 n=1 Tax=Coniella lustricola TaxID=2025994 RepID=A0A2T2ZU54_9PEZI|nr:clathrin adaptor complex small chain-domain-containing protein [Coniella lustricola]